MHDVNMYANKHRHCSFLLGHSTAHRMANSILGTGLHRKLKHVGQPCRHTETHLLFLSRRMERYDAGRAAPKPADQE